MLVHVALTRASHKESAEGIKRQEYEGLAGRRIAGGMQTMAQEPRERRWYLSVGVCRSRVIQPEAYFSCSRFARSFMSQFLGMAQTARYLSFYPPEKRASTHGFIPSMDRITRLYRGKTLTALRSRGGGVLPRGIAGGGISPRTPGLWPTVPWRARP